MVHNKWAFVAGLSMLAMATALFAATLVVAMLKFNHLASYALTFLLTVMPGAVAWNLLLHAFTEQNSEN